MTPGTLVWDFRSRRVASEIAAFTDAGEISRRLAEEAFSNRVITLDVTTLEDVRMPLEDDAVGTARGVEWLYPANQRLLLVK